MTGAVKAAQSGAWLPFALDALVTIGVAAWFTRYLRRDPPAATSWNARASPLPPRCRATARLDPHRHVARRPPADADTRRAFVDAKRLRAQESTARAGSAPTPPHGERIEADVDQRRLAAPRGSPAKPAISYAAGAAGRAARRRISRRRSARIPVVIVCGETGSGKTTQLPKICLDARPRRARAHRPHAAAAHRRARRRRAHRAGAGHAARRAPSATRCASPTRRGPTRTSS